MQTLASLTGEKPLVLYFVKSTCATNGDAIGFYKDLQKSYGDRVNFYGVINTGKDGAEQWKQGFNVEFPLLLDPKREIMKDYSVESSITVFAISPDGTVKLRQNGFSEGSLTELNQFMAQASGQPMASLDFSTAPKQLTPG